MSLEKIKEPYSCEICTNNMDFNHRVVCSFCSVEICESCFQYSITMELKTPCCIYCKKNFSLEFVLENNDTKWCRKTFIPFFENLCLEREKSYLIDTIPKYKKMVEIRELKNELKKIPSDRKIEANILKDFRENFQYDEKVLEGLTKTKLTRAKLAQIRNDKNFVKLLTQKILDKNNQKNKLNEKINLLQDKSNKKTKEDKKVTYICNCPNQKCRGFITNEYFCEICNLEICDSCMVEKKENHICNRNDVKSANMIKESSKPCPKCYSPIFKISGCNQMFCTNCHVVFDWQTLKIDKGNVHNVHYFEWMTSQNNSANINLDEIACGDILEIYRNLFHDLYYHDENYNNIQYVKKIFQINRVLHGEIIENIRTNSIKNNFEKYRIQYLDNKISEKIWKSRIAKDTINNESYQSLIEVFEMYVTITSDFIRQLAFKKIELEDMIKKYSKFYIFFKKSIDETLQIFGGKLNDREYYLISNAKI